VLHGIVREVLQQERVPFEAEPLTGLQVLGMPAGGVIHIRIYPPVLAILCACRYF
jgi:hypothetical protein